MEEGNRSANGINKRLSELQRTWYTNLGQSKDCKYDYYDTSKFSSPFCFGVSEETIKECNNGKKLLMYVGEEARNWWFKPNENNIEYIQKYAIAYFDNQFSDLSKERVAGFNTEKDRSDVQKKNYSAFWEFLRKIKKEPPVAVCWNNLDKLHRVIQNKNGEKETKPLTYRQERELHTAFGADPKHSLLWQEINLVRPDYIIFMGPKYNRSIEWAFGLDKKTLQEFPSKDRIVTKGFENVHFPDGYQPEVFWICHPAWLQQNKANEQVLKELKEQM